MKEIEDMGYYISRIMEVVSQMRSYDECITNQNRLLRKFVASRYVSQQKFLVIRTERNCRDYL